MFMFPVIILLSYLFEKKKMFAIHFEWWDGRE